MCIETFLKYIVIILLILTIIYCFNDYMSESFVNKEDRVIDIANWFKKTPRINYSFYKKTVDDSDIVEYNAAKQLHKSGTLTSENLLNKI